MKSKSRAFTLMELLVVIGIIVLILVMAVPALNFITGSNSIDSAQNNISAMLGRARSEAIGLQKPVGVLLAIDPTSQRVNLHLVEEAAFPPGGSAGSIYLDFVANHDPMAMPPGVGIQLIDDAVLTGVTRSDDGYIGFNQLGSKLVGGVILFDGFGRVMNSAYGFRTQDNLGVETAMGSFLVNADVPFEDPQTAPPALRTTMAFVLFEREPFSSQFGGDSADQDPQIVNPGTYPTAEEDEEKWLDENALPILVNRYNGTLIRSE